MSREFERKFAADAKTLEAMEAAWGPFSSITMETTYFDTPDLKLSARRWTLRQRLENGTSVCAVKVPLEDGSRGEWEEESPHLMQALFSLIRQGAPAELLALTASGLRPLCGAKFTRLARTITLPQAQVELALDRGMLTGGGREQPLWEVEVELKSGDQEAADAFAQELARQFSLKPEQASKQARALALALGG